MMEYRYKIVGYGKRPIERVEFVSETAKFVTFIETGWDGKKHERRRLKKGLLFPTFEEARSEWQNRHQQEAENYRLLMNSELDTVGNAKGLKNPYEGEE